MEKTDNRNRIKKVKSLKEHKKGSGCMKMETAVLKQDVIVRMEKAVTDI